MAEMKIYLIADFTDFNEKVEEAIAKLKLLGEQAEKLGIKLDGEISEEEF